MCHRVLVPLLGSPIGFLAWWLPVRFFRKYSLREALTPRLIVIFSLDCFKDILFVGIAVCGIKLRSPEVVRGDLCRGLDGRKYYLEAGNTAVIFAQNVTFSSSLRNGWGQAIPGFHRVNKRLRRARRGVIMDPEIKENLLYKTSPSKLKKKISKFVKEKKIRFYAAKTSNILPSPLNERLQGWQEKKPHDNTEVPDTDRNGDNSIQSEFKQAKYHFTASKHDNLTLRIHSSNHSLPESRSNISTLQNSSFLPAKSTTKKDSMPFLPLSNSLPLAPIPSHLPSLTSSPKKDFPASRPSNALVNPNKILKASTGLPEESRHLESKRKLDKTNGATVSSDALRKLSCGLDFFTCPDCHLRISFTNIKLTSCSHDEACRCDYVRLREPPYLGFGGRDICSISDLEVPFVTKTKEADIDFFYSRHYEDAFTFTVTAEKNIYYIHEESGVMAGTVGTPFFPEFHPVDYQMEYIFEGSESTTRVKVTFLDFQISLWSIIEIQDTNRSQVAFFNGKGFRPPVLLSSGPVMTLKFSANGQTAKGFRMQYDFLSQGSPDLHLPMTDCGGYVTNFGGFITMMNMTSGNVSSVKYDCVWLIQPPHDYTFKSHLSLKVTEFENMGSEALLEIRQGKTSKDYLLETLRDEGPHQATSQEHVVAVDTGFYVRLTATFQNNSKLAIVYSSFSYLGTCYALTDLLCRNHRCIPRMLRCDGFDQCGDGSDEPASCYKGMRGDKSLSPENAIWGYKNIPNYYFPQKNTLFGHSGSSGALLLSSLLALLFMVLCVLWFMFHQNKGYWREHQHRERRNQTTFNDDVEVFDASADDPPVYEPPPDYEEVIKIILSGSNLKLVRRPGGRTAWVPDIPKDSVNQESEGRIASAEGANVGSGISGDLFSHNTPEAPRKPKRTRHPSLDLDKNNEIVLWQPNAPSSSRKPPARSEQLEVRNQDPSDHVTSHVRRPSLPVTPSIDEYIQKVIVNCNSNVPSVSKDEETLTQTSNPESGPSGVIPEATVPKNNVSMCNHSSAHNGVRIPKRKKRACKKGQRRASKISIEGPLPPSYEMALLQKNLDRNKSIRVSISQRDTDIGKKSFPFRRGSQKRNSAIIRVRKARERFQKLSKGEDVVMSDIFEPKRGTSSPNKINQRDSKGKISVTIGRGIVKTKRSELYKSLHRECTCKGACCCANYKRHTRLGKPTVEMVSPGIVKSKIQFYKTIETGKLEHLESLETDAIYDSSMRGLIKEFQNKEADEMRETCNSESNEVEQGNNFHKSQGLLQECYQPPSNTVISKGQTMTCPTILSKSCDNLNSSKLRNENLIKLESEDLPDDQPLNHESMKPNIIEDKGKVFKEQKSLLESMSKQLRKDYHQSDFFGHQKQDSSEAFMAADLGPLIFKTPPSLIQLTNYEDVNQEENSEIVNHQNIPYFALQNEVLYPPNQVTWDPRTFQNGDETSPCNALESVMENISVQPKASSGAVPKRYPIITHPTKLKRERKNKPKFINRLYQNENGPTNFHLKEDKALLKIDKETPKFESHPSMNLSTSLICENENRSPNSISDAVNIPFIDDHNSMSFNNDNDPEKEVQANSEYKLDPEFYQPLITIRQDSVKKLFFPE